VLIFSKISKHELNLYISCVGVSVPLTAGSCVWNTAQFCFSCL